MLFSLGGGFEPSDLVIGWLENTPHRQANLPVVLLDAQNANPHPVPDLVEVLELGAPGHYDLRDVREPLEAVVDVDEEPEVGDVDDPAVQDVTRLVALGELLPLVGHELLDRQG